MHNQTLQTTQPTGLGPTISVKNSKLGLAIPTINLPPLITCRENAPCSKHCYGLKGNYRFTNVQNSRNNNLTWYNSNPSHYFNMIKVHSALSRYFRWHGTGDIVDVKYLQGMVEVAKANKGTKYLAFTKKYELINSFLSEGNKLPSNLKIVFSNWNEFQCTNPYRLPTAYLNDKKFIGKANIPELAFPCTGKCYECQSCWNMRKGQSVYFNKH